MRSSTVVMIVFAVVFGLIAVFLAQSWLNSQAEMRARNLQANHKPVVAYRAGGIADIVRHEGDGMLAPCGDIAALATALEKLCINAPLRALMAQSGHARSIAEYRWQDKLGLVRATSNRIVAFRKTHDKM